MFTPAYAAPEQWSPDRFGQTGPWTDVFALALTLTELITQRPAIEGTPAAMLAQCLDPSRRPTPRRLGCDVPDAVEDIFVRALAVDPKNRTPSVEALWTELEHAYQMPSQIMALPPRSLRGVDVVPLSEPPVYSRPMQGSKGPDLGDLELDFNASAAPVGAPPQPAAPIAAAPAPHLGALPDLAFDAPAPAPARPTAAVGQAAMAQMMAPIEDDEPLGQSSFDLAGDPARPAPIASLGSAPAPYQPVPTSGTSTSGMAAVGTPMHGMQAAPGVYGAPPPPPSQSQGFPAVDPNAPLG
jgi:serine/threonine-protein kinase